MLNYFSVKYILLFGGLLKSIVWRQNDKSHWEKIRIFEWKYVSLMKEVQNNDSVLGQKIPEYFIIFITFTLTIMSHINQKSK